MNLLTRYRLWRHRRDVMRRYWALPDDVRARVDEGLQVMAATIRLSGIPAEEAARNLTMVARTTGHSIMEGDE